MTRFLPKHKTKFLKTIIALFSFLFLSQNPFGQDSKVIQDSAQEEIIQVSELRQKFITYSLGFVGLPYVYGGDDPDEDGGFDCSGYIQYVAKYGLGMNMERTAQSIYDTVEIIPISQREPGDLVFFKNNMNSSRVTHVGIYLGMYNHGKDASLVGKKVFVSAVSDGPRRGVIITSMDENFWKNHYFATGRFLPSTLDYSKKEPEK